jgi:hypothetical protein
MLRFGQVLSVPRAAVPSKAVAATFSPETQSILEAAEEAAARAVKPIVAKRSQDWVFSVEESWATTTTCGTRCAGEAEARFARLFSMTRPPPGRTMRIISGMAPFDVLT